MAGTTDRSGPAGRAQRGSLVWSELRLCPRHECGCSPWRQVPVLAFPDDRDAGGSNGRGLSGSLRCAGAFLCSSGGLFDEAGCRAVAALTAVAEGRLTADSAVVAYPITDRRRVVSQRGHGTFSCRASHHKIRCPRKCHITCKREGPRPIGREPPQGSCERCEAQRRKPEAGRAYRTYR
jgi:hypothetical protein